MSLLTRTNRSNHQRYRRKGFDLFLDFYRLHLGSTLLVGDEKRETIVVLLAGSILAQSRRLTRPNVFAGKPKAIYVGPGAEIDILAVSTSELMLISAPASGPAAIQIIDKVLGERRGKHGFMRTVSTILPENFPARRLLIGETINDSGNWSSFPPHKHDRKSSGETMLQEVYFFKLEPSTGFAVQRVYDHARLDEIMTIRDNDLVWIPRGYHPVAVPPSHKVYYLWALVGKGRRLKFKTDPAFKWIS